MEKRTTSRTPAAEMSFLYRTARRFLRGKVRSCSFTLKRGGLGICSGCLTGEVLWEQTHQKDSTEICVTMSLCGQRTYWNPVKELEDGNE